MTQNTLANAEYRAEVLTTESKPEALNFGPATLLVALNMAIAATVVIDQFKRAIYYGRDMDQKKALEAISVMQSAGEALKFPIGTGRYRDPQDVHFFMQNLPEEVVKNLSADGLDLRLLHAAIGQFTESGEFIEGVVPSLLGQPVDKVNLLEEQGDSSWYGEIALDALGYSREQCNFANIKKLHDKKSGRYQKGVFDPNAAVNRDVDAERALLEQGAAQEAVAV